MHTEILDQKRIDALPCIAKASSDFYLAGGTGLALQLGHRDSIDFDFFRENSFDTREMYKRIVQMCPDYQITKLQEESDTLSVLLNGEIQLSFFKYPYPILNPTVTYEGLEIASVEDIAAMKLSAITSRSTLKDYVDLHKILQTNTLDAILLASVRKFPTLNKNLVLKSLVYFEDISPEPIRFMPGHEVKLDEIQTFLKHTVRSYKSK